MKKVKYQIDNLVATMNLNLKENQQIDQYGLAIESSAVHPQVKNIEYEPEQFPGNIIKIKNNNVTMLLFENGEGIIAGAKKEKQIKKTIKILNEFIDEYILERDK